MLRTLVLLRDAFLLISALSLAAAFIGGGHWVIVAVLLGQTAFWFSLGKHSVQWRSSCLLVMYVGLAVVGILLGLTLAILLVGTIAMLVAWDLLNFRETLKEALGPESLNLLTQVHLRSLSLAVSLAALLSATGFAIHLDLPLVVVGALALALVWSLTRAAEHLWNSSS